MGFSRKYLEAFKGLKVAHDDLEQENKNNGKYTCIETTKTK